MFALSTTLMYSRRASQPPFAVTAGEPASRRPAGNPRTGTAITASRAASRSHRKGDPHHASSCLVWADSARHLRIGTP